MATKHNEVLRYITNLPIGTQLSVRSMARELEVSDGTAYRAIKEAEEQGIVSTIERVGTIRIENTERHLPDLLTFREVLKISEGEVLGGASGLEKPLNKFIIGAMTIDAIDKYFSPQSLILVGNRRSVQLHALHHNVGVLITGGFKADEEVIQLANLKELPVISSHYDTFTVASRINRSIMNQEITQEILTVNDIYTPISESVALKQDDTVADFYNLSTKTGLSRFPVAQNNRLIGIVTAKDLIGRAKTVPLSRVMTKDVVTAQTHMSVTSVSYRMTWEDIEMIPVVAGNNELLGVVSRQDIMKASQNTGPSQLLNTFQDDIVINMNTMMDSAESPYVATVVIQPEMLNNLGTISYGVLVEMITYTTTETLYDLTRKNHVIEKIDLNYFNMVQLGNQLQFEVNIFHRTRRLSLAEVNVYHEHTLIAKAILTCQMITEL